MVGLVASLSWALSPMVVECERVLGSVEGVGLVGGDGDGGVGETRPDPTTIGGGVGLVLVGLVGG